MLRKYNFFIDEINVRNFGSQGQQRTIVLSLKLAELELVKEKINDCPVLLLDDVLAELDNIRQNYLLQAIGDKTQTIITSVDTLHFDVIGQNYHKIENFSVRICIQGPRRGPSFLVSPRKEAKNATKGSPRAPARDAVPLGSPRPFYCRYFRCRIWWERRNS